ncbi:putative cytochrome P450 [Rosa chinensis]|uniref:Putative cytochrome P450 n=1 Tax=Rosa chinensis TaxID=74649 RepID=A0A2P6PYE7_ROSCH|nr:putative cytochrome P450 [Rosa chinensis]
MKKKGNSDGDRVVLVALKQMFGDLTLNVILKMIAGKRYSVATNEDEKKEAWLFAVGDAIPYLRWLDLGGHEKAMKKTAKEMDAIVGGWLEEHKRKRELGEEGDDIEEPG